MADHNTGLFLPGHIDPMAIATTVWGVPGLGAAPFVGEEAVRVGHGTREGRDYTHVALRLFEVGGLRLMQELELPGPDDVEMHVGQALSKAYGVAVYLLFEDESGYGGHALFRDGALVSRQVIDGNARDPVRRDLEREWDIEVDDSHWVYPVMGDLLEQGGEPIWGAGIRSDHDLHPLITQADAQPVEPPADDQPPRAAAPQPKPASPPKPTGRRSRLRGFVKKLAGRK